MGNNNMNKGEIARYLVILTSVTTNKMLDIQLKKTLDRSIGSIVQGKNKMEVKGGKGVYDTNNSLNPFSEISKLKVAVS